VLDPSRPEKALEAALKGRYLRGAAGRDHRAHVRRHDSCRLQDLLDHPLDRIQLRADAGFEERAVERHPHLDAGAMELGHRALLGREGDLGTLDRAVEVVGVALEEDGAGSARGGAAEPLQQEGQAGVGQQEADPAQRAHLVEEPAG